MFRRKPRGGFRGKTPAECTFINLRDASILFVTPLRVIFHGCMGQIIKIYKFCIYNSIHRFKTVHLALHLQPLTKTVAGHMAGHKSGRSKDTLKGLYSFQVHQQVRDTDHSYTTVAEAIFA